MVNLLLEDGANNYILLQACGYFLRYSQKEQIDGIQGPRFTSGILFAMKLTCWAQLLRNHDLGYSLWVYSLESTQELGRRFYSLCHDVQIYADTNHHVSCTWEEHGETLAIEGKRLEISNIRSGLAKMIKDLQVELRQLVFNKPMTFLPRENVTKCDIGFSPFPRNDLLDINVYDIPHNYIEMGQIFLRKLMILVRLCCLGAPRETELSMITYRNMQIFRSIRMIEKVIRIKSDYHKNKYHKGRSISSRAMTLLYVLPVSVSNLLVSYLMYVRPLELKLFKQELEKSKEALNEDVDEAVEIDEPKELEIDSDDEFDESDEDLSDFEDEFDPAEMQALSDPTACMPYIETKAEYNQNCKHFRMMQYYICYGPNGFWPDYYLYRTHSTMTKKYFGTALTFNDWRHIYELVNVQFSEMELASEVKSMLSKAAGHTELTAAMSYGVDGERSIDVTVANTIKSEFLSQLYHGFLGVDKRKKIFQLFQEEYYIDIGGDLVPLRKNLDILARYHLKAEEMKITALMISGCSFIAVIDQYNQRIVRRTYDCRTVTKEHLGDLEIITTALVFTNAHLILRRPELIELLRWLSEEYFQMVLVSPLIPNYMFETYNEIIGMDFDYYRQNTNFTGTLFYKMFSSKLRLLYLFGHFVRNAKQWDGVIIMYCDKSATPFFKAVVPPSRENLVIFLDVDDEETSSAAAKVQLVVHYGNLLSYMLVMNQIRVQKAAVSLWLGCLDDTFNEKITVDETVSRQYLMHQGCLRQFHDTYFKGDRIPCNEKTNDVTRHCSNCRKKSDSEWTYLVTPNGYDFDVKFWLLAMKSGCLCSNTICSNNDQAWSQTVRVPDRYCSQCGVYNTDMSGFVREDHGPGCRVRFLMRDAIRLCSKQFTNDWNDVAGEMGVALRFRGIYRRTEEHQWENYMMFREKQIVVLAVEYLYQLYFFKKLKF